MNTSVDVLAVMHSALGDLMVAEVGGFDTETNVGDLSTSIDAVADLIKAVGALRSRLLVGGEIVDGCYYYNGYSAPELQTPMADVEAALAHVKGA